MSEWKKNLVAVIRKCSQVYLLRKEYRGFPGGAVVKNPPANVGDMGLSPGSGRFHMPRGN